MTSPEMDRSNINPMPVTVKVNNFPESPRARKTTLRTYVIDPTGLANTLRSVQIADYEPTRLRMVIQSLDSTVALIVGETPRQSPDFSGAALAPGQGIVLAPSYVTLHTFYGPDEFWLNSLDGSVTGRVTVMKEYL